MIEWVGLLPISILVFVGWCAISTIWSSYPVATVAAVVYQLVVAFLAVYVALVRDTIQVVRTIGDVLRFLLALSLALEVFAGCSSIRASRSSRSPEASPRAVRSRASSAPGTCSA